MDGDSKTTDELLADARAAMAGYDPGDGRPATDPGWALLYAVEALDRKLKAGAPLPAGWRPKGTRRAVIRAEVAEEIARSIEADAFDADSAVRGQVARDAATARQHGRPGT